MGAKTAFVHVLARCNGSTGSVLGRGELATITGNWALAEASFVEAMDLYAKEKRLGLVLMGWSRLAWVYCETGRALPKAAVLKAQKWAEERGLAALGAGLKLAVAIDTEQSQQHAAFRGAWERSEGLGYSLQAARARFLFARCMPSHPEVKMRLSEALALARISQPLRVLIEREMC